MGTKEKYGSFRTIFIATAGMILTVFVILVFFTYRATTSSMLLQVETNYLSDQLNATGGTLKKAGEDAGDMAEDLAFWDETVDFVLGENPDYIKMNWPHTTPLQSYKYNFLIIKDNKGKDAYLEFRNYAADQKATVPKGFGEYINDKTQSVMNRYNVLSQKDRSIDASGQDGIIYYEGNAYYIAIRPVASLTREDQTAVGSLAIGYLLDNNFFRNATSFSLTDFTITEMPEDYDLDGHLVERNDDNTAVAGMTLEEIDGNKLLLQMSVRRTNLKEGEQTLDITSLLLLLSSVVFMLVLYMIMYRLVLKPIQRLSSDMSHIEGTDAIEIDKYPKTKEFVALCTSINDMLNRLDQSNISVSVFTSILNGMNSYFLVTDPDTDEILFMNDRTMAHYGTDESAIGKKCWEVMTGETGKCPNCGALGLKDAPEAVITWEDYNKITGRYYMKNDRLIDWFDNRKVHLQQNTDITEMHNADSALRGRLEQQELMSDMSGDFIATNDIPAMITQALRMAGEFMDVSRLLVGCMETEDELIVNYEWVNPQKGTDSIMGLAMPFVPGNGVYERLLRDNEANIIWNEDDGEEGFEFFTRSGVKSIMLSPIYVMGDLWGVLSAEVMEGTVAWSDSDEYLLNLLCSVISGAIARNIAEEGLVRMSSIVNTSTQCIAFINAENEIAYVNQGAVDITGYSQEELLGSKMTLPFDAENARIFEEEMLPKLQDENDLDFEMPILRKDGEERIMSFSISRTAVEDGLGIIGSDITDMRKLQNELREAMLLAEESNKAKSEFLSRMSHEMRTPMNAIIGMTNIAKSSDDNEKKEYCLDRIDEASNHLLGVINDILDMSKIEANKFELSETEFDFEKMLQRVADVLTFRLDEKKQTFVVNVDLQMPHRIVADEQRLSQVITNLMANAVKFTPDEGSVILDAKLVEEQDDICTIEIRVTDTGIGISQEQQERLFRSFEQADGGIARRYGGTGLGLAISKNIVEMMGGEIWVESELGEGSSFAFTIKAERGSTGYKEHLHANISWENLRILAVDDSTDVREYFKNLADMIRVHCDVAASGEEALALVGEHNAEGYNVMFIDWRMPEMDGIALTKEIKERFGENAIVIMISATEWAEIENDATDAGVDRFIAKPLFPSAIVDCINECVGTTRDKENKKVDAGTYNFSGKRILLAEDIEINQEIVMALLADTGVEIDCAQDGIEAVEMFAENPGRYDMIFMDIHMPELDGYGATRQIRQMDIDRAKEIPIVAMTANVFREDIEKCLEAGMNDHVGKPIDYDTMCEKMLRYMQ